MNILVWGHLIRFSSSINSCLSSIKELGLFQSESYVVHSKYGFFESKFVLAGLADVAAL